MIDYMQNIFFTSAVINMLSVLYIKFKDDVKVSLFEKSVCVISFLLSGFVFVVTLLMLIWRV